MVLPKVYGLCPPISIIYPPMISSKLAPVGVAIYSSIINSATRVGLIKILPHSSFLSILTGVLVTSSICTLKSKIPRLP